jgi:hypothetical protein
MDEAWKLVKQADICFLLSILLRFFFRITYQITEYMAMGKCVVANELPEQCQVMEDSGIGRCRVG